MALDLATFIQKCHEDPKCPTSPETKIGCFHITLAFCFAYFKSDKKDKRLKHADLKILPRTLHEITNPSIRRKK